MMIRLICAAMAATCLSGPQVAAQDLDPTLGVTPVEVAPDGRLIVRNGDTDLSCTLAVAGDAVVLEGCTAPAAETAPLSGLSAADWTETVRSAMLDADCKLSTLDAVADIVEREAVAQGYSAAQIDAARDRISARVDEAIDRMLWEGKLTVRDGEFALDSCK